MQLVLVTISIVLVGLVYVIGICIFLFRKFEGRREIWEAPNMTDIGLRSIFSEDHDMYRQTVRRFFQDEVAPQHSKYVLVVTSALTLYMYLFIFVMNYFIVHIFS